MQVSTSAPEHLTSRVTAVESHYSFDKVLLLLPHEALRREFDRATKALVALNCFENPWQAGCLLEWVADFLVPVIKAHHNIEDTIIYPFYVSLNVIIPERQSEDHTELANRERKLIGALKSLTALAGQVVLDQVAIQEAEKVVKQVFEDLRSHLMEHFDDEEKFWPIIVRQCGQGNFHKVEGSIGRYLQQHGDMNAGDPSRLLYCSSMRAMGIIGGAADALLPDETRWGSAKQQEPHVASKGFFFRNMVFPKWAARYRGFRTLISTIYAAPATPEQLALISHRPKSGKYVNKIAKAPAPLFLVLSMCIFYCLAGLPFFAAVANPMRNLKYLKIAVIDLDQGDVGTKLVDFLKDSQASNSEQATFEFHSPPYGKSLEEWEDEVLDGKAWAVVYSQPDATANLQNALSNGCANSFIDSYSPMAALGFSWDQGRSAPVANQYISGFLTPLLNQFSNQYANELLGSMSSADITSCVSNNHQNMITQPISFTPHNLSPISISNVANDGALVIGNILVAVFGANYIVFGAHGGTSALAEDLSPWGKLLLRGGSMMLYSFGIACCFATIIVGLTRDGSSEHLYDGEQWAQVMSLQWLHMLVWCSFFSLVLLKLGPGWQPYIFVLMIIYNVTGGWSTDLSDQGYKHFFQIFPFHWAIYIQRCIFFESQCYRRGISVGILIAYLVVFASLYSYFSIVEEYKFISDRNLVKFDQPFDPSHKTEDDKLAAVEANAQPAHAVVTKKTQVGSKVYESLVTNTDNETRLRLGSDGDGHRASNDGL